ncbi:MAG TPA: hypothetical protein PKE07_01895 [Lacibacter sp.]|nr:hypothetical protein [Lacibacter sp.]HMO87948.1 hypothetical protein [Lacibacter sp.]
MRSILTFLFAFVIVSKTTVGQQVDIAWRTLENIDFSKKYVEEIKGYMLFPKFPMELKKLHGKIVRVTGFTIPVDESGKRLALSAYPYAACFFCGKAGPASVLTVKLKNANTGYRVDQWKTFEGKLVLNETDIHEFYYILDDAKEVKTKEK